MEPRKSSASIPIEDTLSCTGPKRKKTKEELIASCMEIEVRVQIGHRIDLNNLNVYSASRFGQNGRYPQRNKRKHIPNSEEKLRTKSEFIGPFDDFFLCPDPNASKRRRQKLGPSDKNKKFKAVDNSHTNRCNGKNGVDFNSENVSNETVCVTFPSKPTAMAEVKPAHSKTRNGNERNEKNGVDFVSENVSSKTISVTSPLESTATDKVILVHNIIKNPTPYGYSKTEIALRISEGEYFIFYLDLSNGDIHVIIKQFDEFLLKKFEESFRKIMCKPLPLESTATTNVEPVHKATCIETKHIDLILQNVVNEIVRVMLSSEYTATDEVEPLHSETLYRESSFDYVFENVSCEIECETTPESTATAKVEPVHNENNVADFIPEKVLSERKCVTPPSESTATAKVEPVHNENNLADLISDNDLDEILRNSLTSGSTATAEVGPVHYENNVVDLKYENGYGAILRIILPSESTATAEVEPVHNETRNGNESNEKNGVDFVSKNVSNETVCETFPLKSTATDKVEPVHNETENPILNGHMKDETLKLSESVSVPSSHELDIIKLFEADGDSFAIKFKKSLETDYILIDSTKLTEEDGENSLPKTLSKLKEILRLYECRIRSKKTDDASIKDIIGKEEFSLLKSIKLRLIKHLAVNKRPFAKSPKKVLSNQTKQNDVLETQDDSRINAHKTVAHRTDNLNTSDLNIDLHEFRNNSLNCNFDYIDKKINCVINLKEDKMAVDCSDVTLINDMLWENGKCLSENHDITDAVRGTIKEQDDENKTANLDAVIEKSKLFSTVSRVFNKFNIDINEVSVKSGIPVNILHIFHKHGTFCTNTTLSIDPHILQNVENILNSIPFKTLSDLFKNHFQSLENCKSSLLNQTLGRNETEIDYLNTFEKSIKECIELDITVLDECLRSRELEISTIFASGLKNPAVFRIFSSEQKYNTADIIIKNVREAVRKILSFYTDSTKTNIIKKDDDIYIVVLKNPIGEETSTNQLEDVVNNPNLTIPTVHNPFEASAIDNKFDGTLYSGGNVADVTGNDSGGNLSFIKVVNVFESILSNRNNPEMAENDCQPPVPDAKNNLEKTIANNLRTPAFVVPAMPVVPVEPVVPVVASVPVVAVVPNPMPLIIENNVLAVNSYGPRITEAINLKGLCGFHVLMKNICVRIIDNPSCSTKEPEIEFTDFTEHTTIKLNYLNHSSKYEVCDLILKLVQRNHSYLKFRPMCTESIDIAELEQLSITTSIEDIIGLKTVQFVEMYTKWFSEVNNQNKSYDKLTIEIIKIMILYIGQDNLFLKNTTEKLINDALAQLYSHKRVDNKAAQEIFGVSCASGCANVIGAISGISFSSGSHDERPARKIIKNKTSHIFNINSFSVAELEIQHDDSKVVTIDDEDSDGFEVPGIHSYITDNNPDEIVDLIDIDEMGDNDNRPNMPQTSTITEPLINTGGIETLDFYVAGPSVSPDNFLPTPEIDPKTNQDIDKFVAVKMNAQEIKTEKDNTQFDCEDLANEDDLEVFDFPTIGDITIGDLEFPSGFDNAGILSL